MKANIARRWEGAKAIRYLPFEYPSTGALVYSFLAGILASIAGQLFMTPLLSPAPHIGSATLLLSAALLATSSALMILISFELEAFKEDLKGDHSPRNKNLRRMILEKRGIIHERAEPPHRHFGRLRRLWIYLGFSTTSAVYAIVLIWFG